MCEMPQARDEVLNASLPISPTGTHRVAQWEGAITRYKVFPQIIKTSQRSWILLLVRAVGALVLPNIK